LVAGGLTTQAAQSEGGLGGDRCRRIAGGDGKRPHGERVTTLPEGKGSLPPNGRIRIREQRAQVPRHLGRPKTRQGEGRALANWSRGMRQEWIELGRILRGPELGPENDRLRAVYRDCLRIAGARGRSGGWLAARRILDLGHGGRGVER